jgi:hypothetical protein
LKLEDRFPAEANVAQRHCSAMSALIPTVAQFEIKYKLPIKSAWFAQ